MSISVSNISKFYDQQQALKNISFEIPQGQIVGFLGPNGAGKSTLMKILTTYIPQTDGTAVVQGFDTKTHPIEVRGSIGYLPEHNPLYLDMYVREYLSFNTKIYGVKKERVDAVIQQTGLTPEAHKKIGQLSKGYRQRVGIANALLHDPEVLILDEPTTGLDPNQLMEIRDLITTLGKQKTVFLSTHIMQEVEAMCSRAIIINKGEVVADIDLDNMQSESNQIIEVEFDYRVEEAFLLKLPKIKQVTNIHGFVYELHFETQTDMRPTVFDFAHDNELKTLQLNRKNQDLESIFRKLTQK